MNLFNIIKGNYPQSYKEIMIDDSYVSSNFENVLKKVKH